MLAAGLRQDWSPLLDVHKVISTCASFRMRSRYPHSRPPLERNQVIRCRQTLLNPKVPFEWNPEVLSESKVDQGEGGGISEAFDHA